MVTETLDKWMALRQSDLIAVYNRKGLKASGGFEQNLRRETDDKGSRLIAPRYSGVMVTGRSRNANQSPEAIRKWVGWAGSTIIAKWVSDKGIDANPYAVAYKIATQGVRVPNAHNDGGLIKEVFTEDKWTELYRSILVNFTYEIKSEIQKVWQ